jgi:transposase-like protein
MVATELEDAILAEPCTVSTRALAEKLGCSASLVSKVRRRAQSEHGEEGRAQTKRQVERRVIGWVERAELLAEDVERMLQKAAGDPESRKDPKLIHAICGGVKIVFDALGDWKMTNAGSNAKAPGEEGAIPEDSNASGGATVTPIRATG